MSRPQIPIEIKRQVRKNCGSGCVICGEIFCQFEHIENYSDNPIHEEQNIILLCHNHHARVTNGLISKEEIRQHQLNPFCLKNGNKPTSSFLPPKNKQIIFPGFDTTGIAIVCMYNFEKLLWFSKKEDIDTLCLNFKYYDNDVLILKIEDNIIEKIDDSYDIYIIGNRFIIEKESQKKVEFSVINNELFQFEKIQFKKNNYLIEYPSAFISNDNERFDNVFRLGNQWYDKIGFKTKNVAYFPSGMIVDQEHSLISDCLIYEFYEYLIKADSWKDLLVLNKGFNPILEMPIFGDRIFQSHILELLNFRFSKEYNCIFAFQKNMIICYFKSKW